MERVLALIARRSGIALKDARLARVTAYLDTQNAQGTPLNAIEHDLLTASFEHPRWQQIIKSANQRW